MLKRPNYVQYNESGELDKIFCKVCGEQIAGMEAVPVDGKGDIYAFRFRRKPNYAEIKIEFDDGHYHVTNGCKNCLSMDMPLVLLNAILQADDAQQPDAQIMQDSMAKRVVALDITGVGLL